MRKSLGMGDPATVRVRRVYEPVDPDDGTRALVDRLWPRALRRDAAALDRWCKQVTPSAELRTWYGHRPERFEEFAERYRAELEQPDQAAELTELAELSRRGTVTLLTATKDLETSHVTVLAELLTEMA